VCDDIKKSKARQRCPNRKKHHSIVDNKSIDSKLMSEKHGWKKYPFEKKLERQFIWDVK